MSPTGKHGRSASGSSVVGDPEPPPQYSDSNHLYYLRTDSGVVPFEADSRSASDNDGKGDNGEDFNFVKAFPMLMGQASGAINSVETAQVSQHHSVVLIIRIFFRMIF